MYGSSIVGESMNENDLRLLKSSVDKLVKVHCFDGEILVAKILVVWDEYEDVSFDVVSTNRADKYEKYGPEAAHTLKFQDIASVEDASNATSPGSPGGQSEPGGSP
jgi:hypothetical protein